MYSIVLFSPNLGGSPNILIDDQTIGVITWTHVKSTYEQLCLTMSLRNLLLHDMSGSGVPVLRDPFTHDSWDMRLSYAVFRMCIHIYIYIYIYMCMYTHMHMLYYI